MARGGLGGVSDAWPYPVFGALGAGAGAVGGWGVEQSGSSAASVYLLAGGMALVIPTLVAVLNVTVYNTEDEAEDDGSEGNTTTTIEPPSSTAAPGAQPAPAATPGGTPPAPEPAAPAPPTASRRHRRAVPLAFVGVDSHGVRPGVPAVAIYPLYDEAELAKYGAKQGTEVRVPVLSGSF